MHTLIMRTPWVMSGPRCVSLVARRCADCAMRLLVSCHPPRTSSLTPCRTEAIKNGEHEDNDQTAYMRMILVTRLCRAIFALCFAVAVAA